MFHFRFKAIFLAFAISVISSSMAQKAAHQVLEGNGRFTTNLYKVLSKKEGNVFFSPISAHAVLSMAYQGSGGSTQKAFASTLQVPDIAATADGYHDVIDKLNNVENVTLLIANKVYSQEGVALKEAFKTALVNKFKSEVQQLNFANSAASAKTINDWVAQKTKDKIQDLISPDSLDALTRLVLVNAIYFKGNWAQQFKKENTRTEPFYLNDKDTVDVQMMHINNKFDYKHDDSLKAKVLVLPYTNKDISLVVILPDDRDGIKELEAKLENVDLTKITDGTYNTDVEVALPKFKIETTIPLEDTLVQLGLGEIFDQSKADFSNMIEGNERLYVSKVIQKAFIEVNEEGAEAAAATGLKIVLLSLPHKEYFLTDHPFIVALKYGRKNPNVLFYGRVNVPESGDSFIAPKGVPRQDPFNHAINIKLDN